MIDLVRPSGPWIQNQEQAALTREDMPWINRASARKLMVNLKRNFLSMPAPGDTIRIPLRLTNGSNYARPYNLERSEIDPKIIIGDATQSD